jgi:hypothetical protein
MFRWNALVAMQREVKHLSVDMLGPSTALPIVGGATVAWQPTVGRTGLPSGAARCYIRKARPKLS